MSWFSQFLLRIRKAETPFYARLKRFIKAMMVFQLPTPRFTMPFWGLLYYVRGLVPELLRRIPVVLYRLPMFKSQCAHVGKRLYLEQIPGIAGHVHIYVGDDVTISGRFHIAAGRTLPDPEVILGNKVFLGDPVSMQVAQRIELEEGAAVAGGCYITDNDAHPLDINARLRGEPVPPSQIQPVKIGRHAWIGRGSYIMKGVTIGEFAIVGVGSVVLSDVPPYSIAMGNPARIVKKLQVPEDAASSSGESRQ